MIIEYFGKVKLITGVATEEIGQSARLNELLEVLSEKYPEIKNEELMLMVNEKIVMADFVLNPNDKVCLLSVVDGG